MIGPSTCPVCRASRSSDAAPTEPCHRCGSDLELIHACYLLADSHRQRARRALARGDARKAIVWAVRAVRLVDSAEMRETLAAALFVGGRAEAAAMVLGDREELFPVQREERARAGS